MLKTSGYALGFQHSPRVLANVNEWKIMFDPYINNLNKDGMVCKSTCSIFILFSVHAAISTHYRIPKHKFYRTHVLVKYQMPMDSKIS